MPPDRHDTSPTEELATLLGAASRGERAAGAGAAAEGIIAPGIDADAEEILALHEALTRLAAEDARQARVVECRYFAGMSIPHAAEALGISEATVKRDWQLASVWLQRALGGNHEL